MKTIYLAALKNYAEGLGLLKSGVRCFCIGVKTGDSLEWLQKACPKLVIERLPEVANMNYIHLDHAMEFHMLQPAFITWKEPKPVSPPIGSVHALRPHKPF